MSGLIDKQVEHWLSPYLGGAETADAENDLVDFEDAVFENKLLS